MDLETASGICLVVGIGLAAAGAGAVGLPLVAGGAVGLGITGGSK